MFISSILLTCLLLPLITSAEQAGQQPLSEKKHSHSPFDSEFRDLVTESLGYWHVPGVAIGVVDGDDVWTEGFGIASYPSTPVTPRTNFYAGSTSKAFTAAALSLLVDNSSASLTWATPVAHLIRDDFVLADGYATTHTTLEDALSHRTGLPRHDFSYGGFYPDGEGGDGRTGVHPGTVRDAVRALRWLPLTAEPRTRFQYCNLMFVVAAHVVETLTGKWLGDFLRERIWEPLGMDGTYFSTADALASSSPLAQGYVYNKNQFQAVPYMDLTIVSGAGSVISNVIDYTKWLRCLLSSALPLSPAGHAALKTPRMLMPPSPSSPFTGTQSYSLGWWTGVYRGYEYFEHSGGMDAFGTQLIFFPALDYGLVTFGNTAVTSNAVGVKLIWHLVDEKLGIPAAGRYDWDAENKKVLGEAREKYENAARIFYPSIPSPPLPLSRPLAKYAGTYFNPGYKNVTLVVQDGRLHCDRAEGTWQLVWDLEHVTGEHFLAHIDSATAPGLVFKQATAAEFVLGSDGVVRRFGIAGESEMGREARIWFDRL